MEVQSKLISKERLDQRKEPKAQAARKGISSASKADTVKIDLSVGQDDIIPARPEQVKPVHVPVVPLEVENKAKSEGVYSEKGTDPREIEPINLAPAAEEIAGKEEKLDDEPLPTIEAPDLTVPKEASTKSFWDTVLL